MPISGATTASPPAGALTLARNLGARVVLGALGVLQHAARGQHVHALCRDIARRDVLHDAGGTAALWVNQEVSSRVRSARGGDVRRADTRVHVALAVPHVHTPAQLLL